jgi:hypothetical protein
LPGLELPGVRWMGLWAFVFSALVPLDAVQEHPCVGAAPAGVWFHPWLQVARVTAHLP